MSRFKKDNSKKIYIIIVSTIIVMAIIATIAFIVQNKNKNKKEVENIIDEQEAQLNDEVYDEGNFEENETTEENKEVDTSVIDTTQEDLIEEATDDENKAIELAKKYRENQNQDDDEDIYYTVESSEENKYIIAVRELQTTRIVMFYEVNVETEEVTEQ